MSPNSDFGSLTKEMPLDTLLSTIEGITPGSSYSELLQFGKRNTHPDAPGLVRKRFLLVEDKRIVYDHFLSLFAVEGRTSPRVLKVMYYVWAFRDVRLRRFICERIADRHGNWQVRELTNKANAAFFDAWFEASSAKKVRSNLEDFFLKTGIYRPEDRSIHLELDDGWLPLAMSVAAQHERDRTRRLAMTRDSAEFLISNGWHALTNATPDQLRSGLQTVPLETPPLEDEEISIAVALQRTSRPWSPRRLAHSGRRSTTALVNHVARERAASSHQMLERILAEAAKAQGLEPQFNKNIDMHFKTTAGTVLAEMKSCLHGNMHSQIRRGVSQLLEYRYVYADLLGGQVTLLLVIETKPPAPMEWQLKYLDSLGITLVWKQAGGDRLVTTATIPEALHEIAFHSD